MLDNDTDEDGDVLTIISTTPSELGIIQIIDSGRALQFVPNESAAATSKPFFYTVSDGRGGVADARVGLSVAPDTTNTKPMQLRTTSVGVESGGTVSYNVFPDWRDAEGDDLILLGASTTTNDIVRFNADGLVTFSSVASALGSQELTLTVSDGTLPATGKLLFTVTARGVLTPVGTPDFVSTFVGRTAELAPLDNDVSPSGEVLSLGGLKPLGNPIQYVTDPENSRLSFPATAAGTYYLQYTVQAGSAEGTGVIRIDVADDPDEPVNPIAVKDIVYVRASQPALVSPLDNDVSPSGLVLGVQGVELKPEDESKISVEVLGGSHLRVTAIQTLTQPIEFRYTISDGVGAASSAGVTVIPVPDLSKHQAPIAADDVAKVRVGDIISVPVLENDSHPDGAPVTLDPQFVDTNIGDGTAFVTGNKVRLQAPSTPGQYSVTYQIFDAFEESSWAQVIFKVAELDAENNQPPLPRPVTARVFQSSEIEVQLPLDRIDPDGDSVVFVGATGANLGQVTGYTATSFTYKALATSGTEVLTYEVRDAVGASATAQVRIGVIPRGGILAPSAVEDEAGIRPNRTATVGVLSNDSDPNGYAIRLDTLISVEPGITAEIVDNNIVVTAGDESGTFAINYQIVNAENGKDDSFLIVTVAADAPVLAPAAIDHVVDSESVVGQRSVIVDVLAGASNPGGRTSDLVVTFEGANEQLAQVDSEGRVTVQVGSDRTAIAYRLTNAVDDLSAMAFIVVPRYADALPPSLRADLGPQAVDRFPDKIDWTLTDLLDVPSGRDAKIIYPKSMTATLGSGTLEALDDATLRFTPAEGYSGESVLTFQVTDGQSAEDPAGNRAIISFTVAVGNAEKRDQPPTFAPITIEVERGEAGTSFDLRSASAHPNPALVEELQYSNEKYVSGSRGIAHSLSGSDFSSSASANETEDGQIAVFVFEVRLGDQPPVIGQVTVVVVPTKRPMPQAVDDIEPEARSNMPYSLPVLNNDFNPFAADGPDLIVVATAWEGDNLGASISPNASSVTVTTGSAKSGTITVVYTVEDKVGRQVNGKAVFVVASAPEPVTTVTLTNPSTQSVSVVFQPPTSSNGAVITGYTVRMTGSPSSVERTDCVAGASCVFTGRTNGAVQTVEIGATNKVGTSWSTQRTITPYGTPSAPTNPTLSTNSTTATATITPSWSGPADSGGGAITYQWNFTQGLPATVSGSTSGTSAPGQSVGQGDFTFQVRACNPGGCSGYVSASRRIDPAPSAWNLPVDAASSCVQDQLATSRYTPPSTCSAPGYWQAASSTVTVNCIVNSATLSAGGNFRFYRLTSNGYYISQYTMLAPYDATTPVGMPGC